MAVRRGSSRVHFYPWPCLIVLSAQYPWEVIKKAHAEGLLNVHVPEEVRGSSLSYRLSRRTGLMQPIALRNSTAALV